MSDVTHQITEYCLKILLNQIGRTLDAAPDYLTLLAEQTNFDNERTMYLDAMHELRFTRKKYSTPLPKKLRNHLSYFSGALYPKSTNAKAD